MGIQAYPQPQDMFSLRETSEKRQRGGKSLAGLMAYPVVLPRDIPIDIISIVTGNAPDAPRPVAAVFSGREKAIMQNTRSQEARNSQNRFRQLFGIAGIVQNVPSLTLLSGVAS